MKVDDVAKKAQKISSEAIADTDTAPLIAHDMLDNHGPAHATETQDNKPRGGGNPPNGNGKKPKTKDVPLDCYTWVCIRMHMSMYHVRLCVNDGFVHLMSVPVCIAQESESRESTFHYGFVDLVAAPVCSSMLRI